MSKAYFNSLWIKDFPWIRTIRSVFVQFVGRLLVYRRWVLELVSKKRMFDVTKKLESLCAADKELKENARKGFLSVMKTLYVLDKAAFQTVDRDAFAASLGLVQTPKLPFLNKKSSKAENDEEDSEDEDVSIATTRDKATKTTLNFGISDDEEDDKIYQVVKDSKRDIVEGGDEPLQLVEEGRWTSRKKSTVRQKLKLLKQTTRITFDDEGNPEEKDKDASDDETGLNIDKAKLRLKEQDKIDKEMQRQRVKAEHREKRLKEKDKRRQAELAKRGATEEEEDVVLGTTDGEVSKDGKDVDEENDDDDSDDDGPVPKRRKVESANNSDSVSEGENEIEEEFEDSNEEDDDDDDDVMESASEADNNSSEIEEEDDDSHLGQEHIEEDEAAVLALLGGKR